MKRIGSRVVWLLVVAALCSLPVQGMAAMAGANTVNSAAIVDGAVATADLANLAVTTAKIANGAVTDAKISGLVSTSKLNVGTSAGTVAAGDHSHVIATANIADGAVTDAKISGTLSASKVATYANTYVVHKGTANNVSTFNGIMACINSITNNTANWSGERVVIKVMPGRYVSEDLSALASSTQLNVDIIGTSRESVVIAPTGGDTHLPSGTNLRSLTFEGNINVDHTVNSGIYDAKLIHAPAYNGHVVSAGWQGIKNFTMDNVEIVTWEAAMGFWGNQFNDTNVFNNLKIVAMTPYNSGHISIVYPSSIPYKFTNISFYGQGGTCFNFVQNSNTTINLDNIKVEGDYINAISIQDYASNLNVNVSNSRLNTSVLISGASTSINTTFNNTYIRSLTNILGSVKIANSQINGAIPASNGQLTIVNSFDTNYALIANGQY